MPVPQDSAPARIRPEVGSEGWIMRGCILLLGGFLMISIALPLYTLLSKSFQNADGLFIGLTNYAAYFSTPALIVSISNSFTVALITTTITLVLAFVFAYALTRSCMRLKWLFRALALIPLLMPSLLPAISLIYLFGNQGMIKGALMGESIYGPIGIVMGQSFYVFPHALIILVIALSTSDARLYEAARSLGAGSWRTFFTVTLPSARYGLISAFFVTFTLVITDFGVPKVIGGQYNVLATDVYKQVVGRLDFEMGAVVGMVLLAPAILAFIVDRMVQRKQVAVLSARAVPYVPTPSRVFDSAMFGFCTFIGLIMIGILGVAAPDARSHCRDRRRHVVSGHQGAAVLAYADRCRGLPSDGVGIARIIEGASGAVPSAVVCRDADEGVLDHYGDDVAGCDRDEERRS